MFLFRIDKTHNRLLSNAQLRVVRGQLWNLRESLLAHESPFVLVKRTRIIVTRRYHDKPPSTDWAKCFRIKLDDTTNRACC